LNPIEYERMFRAEETQWWYAGQRRIAFGLLDRQLGGVPGRALDAGCGSGRNLLELNRRGTAVGVDLAPEALAFCRLRKVQALRGDLLRLPFSDDRFDVVTSFDVLYHRWVEDDRATVRELARVLRPGGVLLVRVPALSWLWGAHDAAVHSRHRYTRRELESVLSDAGLEIRRSSYCNSLLLPLLAARRFLDRSLKREGSDVAFLPAPLEWLFGAALRLEAVWLTRFSLPLGASAVAVALKPGGATRQPVRIPCGETHE
jgi:SAM-dependent methyltransferase